MLNFTLYQMIYFYFRQICCSFMRIQRLRGPNNSLYLKLTNLASRHKLPGWNVNSVTNICLKNVSLKTSFLVKTMVFSSSHVWIWELDYKESWALKNWCFWTVVLTFESPWDCKEIEPVNPKGNQSWTVIGRTDAEAETFNTLVTWC